MGALDSIHRKFVHGRRARILCDHLAVLIPVGARVLDIGCGDGLVGRLIMDRRPDLEVFGIDVLVRPATHVPVGHFDGRRIPLEDGSVDVAMMIDVLHHSDDPMGLLRDAARVVRRSILLKDHLSDGFLAPTTLRFMDRVGNERYGVHLPFNYWPRRRWAEAFAELGLRETAWRQRLGLYAVPFGWLFDRSLHFIARLDVTR